MCALKQKRLITMKKVFAMFAICGMMFAAVACGNKAESTEETVEETMEQVEETTEEVVEEVEESVEEAADTLSQEGAE